MPSTSLENVVVRFVGDSGDGMQLVGSQFTLASAVAGNDLATLPDFPAEIRAPAGTTYGVSGFQLNFAQGHAFTPGDQPHALVCMNPAALKKNLEDLILGGTIIANADAFTGRNLKLVDYTSNPLEDGSLEGYKVYAIPMTTLTVKALEGMDLDKKAARRCTNFFALGMVSWIYHRPTDPTLDFIAEKFARKPVLAEANATVFKAGYAYGETVEAFAAPVVVPAADIPPGEYRTINGNQSLALGLVTAAEKSGLDLIYAGYPITPASSILEELAALKHMGVRTLQAEDEIAAIGMALGASFAGALGVTASSGPGICLKGEFLGLAVSTELPLVVVDVQRGGPSTGLPTKTEQSDLLLALYGRHGECPLPVLAARSPAEATACP
ncbi:MAG: 2-oxoacid:acceptor oxidoreductase family protein [Planctomycetota bacterium]